MKTAQIRELTAPSERDKAAINWRAALNIDVRSRGTVRTLRRNFSATSRDRIAARATIKSIRLICIHAALFRPISALTVVDGRTRAVEAGFKT